MPSEDETFSQRAVSETAELDPIKIELWWGDLQVCLREVFGKSDDEAETLVAGLRTRTGELSQTATLLLYHDSPLQVASMLAGAAHRELTEQELIAYDELWDPGQPDRPAREEILNVHRVVKAG